jgi:hypothetical protein
MHSKNLTALDREHLARVKELPCSVCDAAAPSEAHHIEQGLHYTCVALCVECHRGYNGLHGTKALWRIRKMSEIDALNVTIKRMFDESKRNVRASF